MSKKTFKGKSLEECLEMASAQLQLNKENVKYEIIEEKHGFFKKKVTISVEVEEEQEKNNNGSIRVQEGEIIIKNPKEGGRPAVIRPSKKIRILVDGEQITSRKEVLEGNSIEFIFEENAAERRLEIKISPDKMQVYADVKFIPQNVYVIEDAEESYEFEPQVKLKEQLFPRPYTIEEIKEQLALSGVKYGILEDELKKLAELKDVENLLVAKGEEVIDDVNDSIDFKFDSGNDKKFEEDKKGTIDYKSIGHIKTVKKDDVLAIRIEGIEGKDGIDVCGAVKKRKTGKKIKLDAGDGCELKDENTIIASMEGKPSIKGNKISVHSIHKVDKDVDISTGNIDFVGDVIVFGNVLEGMKVEAGHDLLVNKNVNHAKLTSRGNMTIHGNVITSTLSAGGGDIVNLNKLTNLQNLKKATIDLISTVEHIKKFNLLGKEVKDGEITKVLLENKFKFIIPFCNDFLRQVPLDSISEEKKLAASIQEKLIGLGPLHIKNISELNDLTEKIDKVEQLLNGTLEVPVDIQISYCQDSIINSSGNIILTGKGEYVSKITAHGRVEFTSPSALARGGIIIARDEIKCKNVGSEGGVSTKLITDENGHIWVDRAYQNTCFIIGRKEYILEVPSKDIHAYLNNEGELVVDKFVL